MEEKKEEIETERHIKKELFSLPLGCCHATDGLWEFCCTRMSGDLAG